MKRKRNAKVDGPNKKAPNLSNVIATTGPPSSPAAIEPKTLGTVISDEELEITVETLTTLAEYPSVIKSKACKDLRVAVYDFRQACTTGVNTAGEQFQDEIYELV